MEGPSEKDIRTRTLIWDKKICHKAGPVTVGS